MIEDTLMTQPIASLSTEDALIAVMVAVAASDENMKTAELVSIASIVNHLPIFGNYDVDRIETISKVVYDLFEEKDGLDALFALLKDALPPELFETSYALACDIAAADGRVLQSELLFLETLRHEFNIAPLQSAAIEYTAKLRHKTLYRKQLNLGLD